MLIQIHVATTKAINSLFLKCFGWSMRDKNGNLYWQCSWKGFFSGYLVIGTRLWRTGDSDLIYRFRIFMQAGNWDRRVWSWNYLYSKVIQFCSKYQVLWYFSKGRNAQQIACRVYGLQIYFFLKGWVLWVRKRHPCRIHEDNFNLLWFFSFMYKTIFDIPAVSLKVCFILCFRYVCSVRVNKVGFLPR